MHASTSANKLPTAQGPADQMERGPGRPDREHAAPRRILVGLDGTDSDDRLVRWATTLAQATRADILLATALLSPRVYAKGNDAMAYMPLDTQTEDHLGKAVLDRCAALIETANLRVERHLVRGAPGEALCALAEAEAADLIVVGPRSTRLERAVLPSVSAHVTRRARCDVLWARGEPNPRDEILVAVDESPSSHHAARLGIRLAHAWDTRVTLLHAHPARSASSYVLEAAVDEIPESWASTNVAFEYAAGNAPGAILRRVRRGNVGMILVGSRSVGFVARVLGRSVSMRVAHDSPVSVLIVKDNAAPKYRDPGIPGG